jgi:hypothetical protein
VRHVDDVTRAFGDVVNHVADVMLGIGDVVHHVNARRRGTDEYE